MLAVQLRAQLRVDGVTGDPAAGQSLTQSEVVRLPIPSRMMACSTSMLFFTVAPVRGASRPNAFVGSPTHTAEWSCVISHFCTCRPSPWGNFRRMLVVVISEGFSMLWRGSVVVQFGILGSARTHGVRNRAAPVCRTMPWAGCGCSDGTASPRGARVVQCEIAVHLVGGEMWWKRTSCLHAQHSNSGCRAHNC